MDVNFTDFDLRSPLLSTDYIIGYKQDASTEYRATIATLLNTIESNLYQPEILSIIWLPPSNVNIPVNAIFTPPYNLINYITNINVFDVVNNNSSLARIFIKQPGYYEFNYQLLIKSLNSSGEYDFNLAYSNTNINELSSIKTISKKYFQEQLNESVISFEAQTTHLITTPGYYTVTVNISALDPETDITYSTENNIPSSTLTVKKIKNYIDLTSP